MKIHLFFILSFICHLFLHSHVQESHLCAKTSDPKQLIDELLLYKKNQLCFSDAVRELAAGVADSYFGEEIYRKIEELEKNKISADFIDYWENGQIKLRGAFRNHFAEGHIHGWYKDGTDAFKGHFTEGKRRGIHITFYPLEPKRTMNAMARVLVFNKLGHFAGYQTICHRSGRLHAAIKFRDGILNGKSEFFEDDSFASTCQEFYYSKGKFLKTKTRLLQ